MMQIQKAKNPKQIHYRYGWDERIFFFEKQENNKQTYYLNKRVVEGTSTATQVQLTFNMLTLSTMIR